MAVARLALLLVPLIFAPLAGAQSTMYGTTSGDPRFREDAAACWETVEEGSDTTCSVLYAHILDLLNTVPLNTQRPPDFAEDVSAGFSNPGVEPLWDLNQMTFSPTPGMIGYDADGDPARVHHERGFARDLHFDPHVPLRAYWSMSADLAEFRPLDIDEGPDGSDARGGVLPCLTVRVTIDTGRFPGEGERLTSGQTTKSVVSGGPDDPPRDAEALCPDGTGAPVATQEIVEFEVVMPPIERVVTRDEGFVVQVEWWNHAPGDPEEGEKVYLNGWNVHGGPDHVPRLVLPLRDVLTVEDLSTTFVEDQLQIEVNVQSTFGAYDVDASTLRLQVLDAAGRPVETGHSHVMLRYGTERVGFFRPLPATIVWDHQEDDLPPGAYTLRVSARNWQWSDGAQAETTIVLGAAIEESGPPSLLPPLLFLVLLAGLRTRRGAPPNHRNP